MAEDALGVGPVERQAGEELRRHAPAAAGAIGAARIARPTRRRPAEPGEEVAPAPDAGESASSPHGPGPEFGMHHERAGVDVTDRVDQADDPAGAAQVQAGERLVAERAEVEEGVTREHLRVLGEEGVHIA